MPKTAMVILLAALAVAVSAPVVSDSGLPKPDAASVWNYISKVAPYQKWQSWPDYQGLHRARSPHGPYNKVYVNQVGLSSKKAPVNYGTMEVKVAQTKEGQVRDITVQYKVKGYNPGAGDWFWAVYTPQGQAKASGQVKGCIRCHGAAADNDYIMVHSFK
ncbi:MAG: cytochrome P460 family protein [Thermodesulfobacteriota bacterium]